MARSVAASTITDIVAAMAVESTPFHFALGTPVPDVSLPDINGESIHLTSYAARRPLLVLFGCNHCPYVRHIETALGALVDEYPATELAVIAISSNDVDQYPDDDIAGLQDQRDRAGWHFPYLVDAEQHAAKAFNAACTPDFFLFDRQGALVYRGAFDASSPKNSQPLTGDLLRAALDSAMRGEGVPEPHRPALGCGIKWKPGNESPVVVG